MALQMTTEERLQALKDDEPAKPLVKLRAKDGPLKDYSPAAWRFYELTLRSPKANFARE